MDRFDGRMAVVTGAGTGMGRELTRALATEGCSVAICDLNEATMSETRSLALADAPSGTQVSTFRADVSDRAQMDAFAAAVAEVHDTDHIHLLFNNAGIGGGGSFVTAEPDEWERTFSVCWGGAYNGLRAFLPMLMAATEGHVINTSSINGFWASLGPRMPNTAYCAAKFAIKGFSEALLTDFRLNAPHLKVSVVMPGHIGTEIVHSTFRVHGNDPKEMTESQVERIRQDMARQGIDLSGASDEDVRNGLVMQADMFRDLAPTSAEQAARIILDGVRAGQWRILVGDDAVALDRLVREHPTEAYDPDFLKRHGDAGLGGSLLAMS